MKDNVEIFGTQSVGKTFADAVCAAGDQGPRVPGLVVDVKFGGFEVDAGEGDEFVGE